MALASLAKIVAADCSGYNGNDPSAKDAYWFQETEIPSTTALSYKLHKDYAQMPYTIFVEPADLQTLTDHINISQQPRNGPQFKIKIYDASKLNVMRQYWAGAGTNCVQSIKLDDFAPVGKVTIMERCYGPSCARMGLEHP